MVKVGTHSHIVSDFNNLLFTIIAVVRLHHFEEILTIIIKYNQNLWQNDCWHSYR